MTLTKHNRFNAGGNQIDLPMGCDIVHSMERERIAREIFAATLGAANPAEATGKHAGRLRALFQEERYGRLFVIGFGKAAVPMARALEEPLGDLITGGIVITRYGHTSGHPGKVRVIEAGHPVPDDNGVRGTGGILDLVANVDERTLVVVLVSGGGSALFVSPCAGISLGAKQETTELLLRAGAEIDELNRVRKHLSQARRDNFSAKNAINSRQKSLDNIKILLTAVVVYQFL